MIRWLRSLYLRQIWILFLVFVGPCPVLCCFAVLLCGETQIWLGDLRVVFGCVFFLFFVCRCFRDDLPKFLDHTCPCTFLLFTAYAIVRTEPSANRPNRREKKSPSNPQVDLQPAPKKGAKRQMPTKYEAPPKKNLRWDLFELRSAAERLMSAGRWCCCMAARCDRSCYVAAGQSGALIRLWEAWLFIEFSISPTLSLSLFTPTNFSR